MFFKKIDMKNWIRHLSVIAVILLSGATITAVSAAQPSATTTAKFQNQTATLAQSRALKEDIAELNADLVELERDILYPTETQLAFFVAMDEGSFFQLKKVELFMDEKKVSSFKYVPKQVYALQMGGNHRMFMGNYPSGEYNVKAVVHGVGPWGRPYRRIAMIDVEKKANKAKQLELHIIDGSDLYRPDFEIKAWK